MHYVIEATVGNSYYMWGHHQRWVSNMGGRNSGSFMVFDSLEKAHEYHKLHSKGFFSDQESQRFFGKIPLAIQPILLYP